MVKRMEAKGIIVDVAHASDQVRVVALYAATGCPTHGEPGLRWQVVRDVASMATKPFVVSHTGVQGTCELDRNLSDELLKAIGEAGGLVGIGFFKKVCCSTGARGTAPPLAFCGLTRVYTHAAHASGPLWHHSGARCCGHPARGQRGGHRARGTGQRLRRHGHHAVRHIAHGRSDACAAGGECWRLNPTQECACLLYGHPNSRGRGGD